MALWHREPKQRHAAAPSVEPAPPFPAFPYHPDPIETGSVVESAAARVLCGHAHGLIHNGPVFAEREDPPGPLCPWCIADGSAAARLHVEFTDVRRHDVPDEVPGRVLAHVAQRTPGFTGHQQERWLYHCSDGAAFVGRTEAAGETAYRFRCRHCGVGLAYSDSP